MSIQKRTSMTTFYPGFSNGMIAEFCNENGFRLICFDRKNTGYVDVFFEHSADAQSPYVTHSKVDIAASGKEVYS